MTRKEPIPIHRETDTHHPASAMEVRDQAAAPCAPGAVGLLQLGVDLQRPHRQVLLEPRVLLDIRHGDAVPRVHRQHAADQVPTLGAHLSAVGRRSSLTRASQT